MYNADEITQAISIALVVAGFFFNTNRFLKSIELCKECLIILKEIVGIKDDKLTKSFYVKIYFTMWKACSRISDNTNVIKYAKRVAKLTLNLSYIYFHENKFAPAKDLSQKALIISKEILDKNGEASSHQILGKVYDSVGKYEKAREHLEKSLAIQREIGDRQGEAS